MICRESIVLRHTLMSNWLPFYFYLLSVNNITEKKPYKWVLVKIPGYTFPHSATLFGHGAKAFFILMSNEI